MATRRQVREAFYAELEAAASAYLTADDIRQEYPQTEEDLPSIVHVDDYRKVPMNRSAAPTRVDFDANGGETTYYYSTMREARFGILVLSDNEQEKEDIYEAVYSYFEDYTTPAKDASTIQQDVSRVEVTDVTAEDTTSRDPPARGDRLAVNVQFERLASSDVYPTDTVDMEVDADTDDGTSGETRTIT